MKYEEAQAAFGKVVQLLQPRNPGIEFHAAGSLRRRCETVNDLDIVVTHTAAYGRAAVPTLNLNPLEPFDYVERTYAADSPLTTIDLDWHNTVSPDRLRIDFRMTSRATFGATMAWLTGPRGFGDLLAQRAADLDRPDLYTFGPDGLTLGGVVQDISEDHILLLLVGKSIALHKREEFLRAQGFRP